MAKSCNELASLTASRNPQLSIRKSSSSPSLAESQGKGLALSFSFRLLSALCKLSVVSANKIFVRSSRARAPDTALLLNSASELAGGSGVGWGPVGVGWGPVPVADLVTDLVRGPVPETADGVRGIAMQFGRLRPQTRSELGCSSSEAQLSRPKKRKMNSAVLIQRLVVSKTVGSIPLALVVHGRLTDLWHVGHQCGHGHC